MAVDQQGQPHARLVPYRTRTALMLLELVQIALAVDELRRGPKMPLCWRPPALSCTSVFYYDPPALVRPRWTPCRSPEIA